MMAAVNSPAPKRGEDVEVWGDWMLEPLQVTGCGPGASEKGGCNIINY